PRRADVPGQYPAFQTDRGRFQQWVRFGDITRVMTAVANELAERGAIDVREAFIDASFAPAKKGVLRSGRQNAAKEPKSWRLRTVMVSPLPSPSKVLHPMK